MLFKPKKIAKDLAELGIMESLSCRSVHIYNLCTISV